MEHLMIEIGIFSIYFVWKLDEIVIELRRSNQLAKQARDERKKTEDKESKK